MEEVVALEERLGEEVRRQRLSELRGRGDVLDEDVKDVG